VNPTLLHRINAIEAEMDSELDLSHLARERVNPELLRQCVASGQVESRQIAAHIKASELDGIGNECALPIVVNDIKRVPEEMSASGAFLGLLAIAVLVGLVGFAVYTIAPLVASSFN
jgi:hypothetical protein